MFLRLGLQRGQIRVGIVVCGAYLIDANERLRLTHRTGCISEIIDHQTIFKLLRAKADEMIHRATVGFGLEVHQVGIDRVVDDADRRDAKQDAIILGLEIEASATGCEQITESCVGVHVAWISEHPIRQSGSIGGIDGKHRIQTDALQKAFKDVRQLAGDGQVILIRVRLQYLRRQHASPRLADPHGRGHATGNGHTTVDDPAAHVTAVKPEIPTTFDFRRIRIVDGQFEVVFVRAASPIQRHLRNDRTWRQLAVGEDNVSQGTPPETSNMVKSMP